jgi:hypothetical protein
MQSCSHTMHAVNFELKEAKEAQQTAHNFCSTVLLPYLLQYLSRERKLIRLYAARTNLPLSEESESCLVTMLVQYAIQIPGDEPAVETGSFDAPSVGPSDTMTLSLLKQLWPFAGNFHFRVRVILPPQEFEWQDLVADDNTLPSQNGVAVVRALPLFSVSMQPTNDFTLSPVEYEAWLHENARRRATNERQQAAAEDPACSPAIRAGDFDQFDARAPAPRAAAGESGGDAWSTGAVEPAESDLRSRDPTTTSGSGKPSGAASSASIASSASAIADSVLSGFRGFVASASRAVAAAARDDGGDIVGAAAPSESTAAKKSSGSGGGGWLSGLTKGARSALAKALDRGGQPASAAAVCNLASLFVLLHTPVKPKFTPHDSLLRRLWHAAFGADEQFSIPSPLWKQVRMLEGAIWTGICTGSG